MKILINKLYFNEVELHLIVWDKKPCFMVAELSEALETIGKDEISKFLRKSEALAAGVDYAVVEGASAKELKAKLEECSIQKRFIHTMLIYPEGLNKFVEHKNTRELIEFKEYLERKNVFSDKYHTYGDLKQEIIKEDYRPESSIKAEAKAHKPASKPKPAKAIGYSELLKHISFMEDFVAAFNGINIPPEKSVAFTKEMVRFFEEAGVDADKFLAQLKKWEK